MALRRQFDLAAEREPNRDPLHDHVLEIEPRGGTLEGVGSGSRPDEMLTAAVELISDERFTGPLGSDHEVRGGRPARAQRAQRESVRGLALEPAGSRRRHRSSHPGRVARRSPHRDQRPALCRDIGNRHNPNRLSDAPMSAAAEAHRRGARRREGLKAFPWDPLVVVSFATDAARSRISWVFRGLRHLLHQPLGGRYQRW